MTTATTSRLATWWRQRWQDMKRSPYTDYTIILVVVGFLTLIGIAMVASSSMTWSVLEGAGVWDSAIRQVIMVAMGLFVMWLMMRTSPAKVRTWAGGILFVAFVLLGLVLTPLGTGREEVGSQSWLMLGPISFQPSEFARVAIAIWGASYIAAAKDDVDRRVRTRNFVVVAALMAIAIFLEGDVGMVVAFGVVALSIVFFVGTSLARIFVPLAFVGVIGAIVMLQRGSFRGERLRTYTDAFAGNFSDTRGSAYQSYQGFLSLADGGFFGVGIGQSRAKWFYLPEARNDFIFAIIGEELGFIGASLVIMLFSLLGFMGFRTVMRVNNTYLALLAGALTSSIVIQAFINMGYVVGLLPVTGIQLPLISAGGTSAVITLAAMGLLVNCARHEPETISAMQNKGRPKFDLALRLPEPSVENIEPRRKPDAPGVKRKTPSKSKHQQPDRRPQQRHMGQAARTAEPAAGTRLQSRPHYTARGQSSSDPARERHTRRSSEQPAQPQREQQPQLRRRRPPSNRWR